MFTDSIIDSFTVQEDKLIVLYRGYFRLAVKVIWRKSIYEKYILFPLELVSRCSNSIIATSFIHYIV